MKLRHKTVLIIVAICSCISMFCIGFANWSYGAAPGTATGTISAEEVQILNSCITANVDKADKGIELYRIAENYAGFVVNEEITHSSEMKICLKVDLAELRIRNSLPSMQGSEPHLDLQTNVSSYNFQDAALFFTEKVFNGSKCYYYSDTLNSESYIDAKIATQGNSIDLLFEDIPALNTVNTLYLDIVYAINLEGSDLLQNTSAFFERLTKVQFNYNVSLVGGGI